ncbi:capsular polysaccharide biosynthesis protein CapF [Acetobacterium sp.]|uniref:capsular polysaccharide biosynthesis protein CapF n=1 Tax=Acetobacterium sp. TaxID=1872094 RepID=UPI002F42C63B
MKVLVTGANGFLGKNLVTSLKEMKYIEILTFGRNDDDKKLQQYTKECNFVFHLAGVNRPTDTKEFMVGNYSFTKNLLGALKLNKNTCPILFASSTQAKLNNPYGESKKAGEDLLRDYGKLTGSHVLIYRFPNVFGKWCRPNYNSVVATFCHNIAHEIAIKVNDPSVIMNLVYIDDLIEELINALDGKENRTSEFCEVPVDYTIALGEIVDLIDSFKKSREDRSIPDMSDAFTKKLYSTYLSYLPENQFSYELKMNVDNRGSFTEFIKTPDRGQISVNISKPGIIKGNHWHHTKSEKFLVVWGKGVIRFRKIDTDKVLEYFVAGDKMEVVDIPIGYTHNIENLGEDDMVTIMWANEPFDLNKPDTYYMEV